MSLNVLNGGKQDREDGNYDCVGTGMGGFGTRYPNCLMTADQVRTWGKALVPYACFMMMWQYDAAYFSKSANQLAFKDVAVVTDARAPRGFSRIHLVTHGTNYRAHRLYASRGFAKGSWSRMSRDPANGMVSDWSRPL